MSLFTHMCSPKGQGYVPEDAEDETSRRQYSFRLDFNHRRKSRHISMMGEELRGFR